MKQDARKITIDKEFKSLIPAIAEAELAQLEANLQAHGCIDALVCWDHGDKLILLDGHNRFKLCNKYGISHRIKALALADRNAATNWIINHQLGRRNITEEQRRYLLGKLYNERKPEAGSHASSATVAEEETTSAATVAEEHGVSERTVHNAADYAATVDAIGEKSPDLKAAILAGDVKASASDLQKLAEAPKRTVESVTKKIEAGDTGAIKAAVEKLDKPPTPPKPKEPFEDIFAATKRFNSIVQQLGKTHSAIDELRKSPAGVFLAEAWQRIEAELKNAQREVKFATPDRVCPYCKGAKCKPQGGSKSPCRQTGWVSKGVKGPGE